MSLSGDSTEFVSSPEICQDPADNLCWRWLDDIPAALFVIDPDLRLLSINDRFEEMTGHRREDLSGQSVSHLMRTVSGAFPEHFFRSIFSADELQADRESAGFELWYAEGRLVPIDLRVSLINGRILLGSICERQRTQGDLIGNQLGLREILDNTEAVVYVKGVDGRYRFVNRRFEELFHFSLEELIGKSDREIFPKNLAQEFRRNDIEVIEQGITIQVKEIAPHQDGPHLYLSSKFPLRNETGEIYATAGISTDITQMDRKEREVEQLKTSLELILNSVSDGIIGTNRQGEIQHINRAARKMFRLESDSPEAHGQLNRQLVWTSPQESQAVSMEQLLGEVLKSSSEVLHYPTAALARADGTTLPVDISGRLTENEDGTVGSVVTLRDISHLRKLQENADELRTAQIVQRQLYPAIPPRINGFRLAGTALPATQACGDYFDFIPRENGSDVVLTIGDVTGHGLGPALQMVETRAYLRAMIHQHGDLKKSISKLNEFLVDDTPEGSFISLLAARLDPVTHTLRYVGAGHDAWLFRAGGEIRHLPSTGLLLGLMKESVYSCSDEIPLYSGDLLLMITDGLQEALSRTGELFGTDRLLQFVQQHREQEPADLIECLITELRQFMEHRPIHDDITIVMAEMEGASPP